MVAALSAPVALQWDPSPRWGPLSVTLCYKGKTFSHTGGHGSTSIEWPEMQHCCCLADALKLTMQDCKLHPPEAFYWDVCSLNWSWCQLWEETVRRKQALCTSAALRTEDPIDCYYLLPLNRPVELAAVGLLHLKMQRIAEPPQVTRAGFLYTRRNWLCWHWNEAQCIWQLKLI